MSHTEALINVATGRLAHDYAGACPDAINGYDARDPECPACRAIDAALSLPDPSAAPVDLREIECPPDPDAVDRALGGCGWIAVADRLPDAHCLCLAPLPKYSPRQQRAIDDLTDVESLLGGRNGPSIRLRAYIESTPIEPLPPAPHQAEGAQE